MGLISLKSYLKLQMIKAKYLLSLDDKIKANYFNLFG